MNPLFDIFLTEGDGKVNWLESVETLEAAKARVQELGARAPGAYIIFSHGTGNKVIIKAGDVDGNGGPDKLRIPAWEKAYQGALLEVDAQKLQEKVIVAEFGIIQRLQELASSPDEDPEKIALRDASRALLSIKIEKLNFPDWKKDPTP